MREGEAIGDAIRVPTVIDIMRYDDENVKEHVIGRARLTASEMAKRIFGTS